MTPPGSPFAGSPFAGFWMGGFEGADHVNADGTALDMARASGHLDRLDEDHRRAAQAGLSCVRESIGWRLCEDAGGAIDLGRALRIRSSARRHGLQVLWTLVHYGLPEGLGLHDDALVPRLARFAREVARVLRADAGPAPMVFTLVNEISYLSWAASQPGLLRDRDAGTDGTHESSRISGYVVKRRLVRAALAAMAAMREELPDARFMHVEPMLHVVAPHGRPDLEALAAEVRSWQWQAWDLLGGRIEPALGGTPQALDLVGINHYHSSQWEADTEARLDWAARDPRRCPLHRLLGEAWQRYGRPLVLAETSHVGAGRADWLHEMAGEVRQAQRAGVPVQGLCLYPLVDRPDWQRPAQWHRSGLWHVDEADPALRRRAEPAAMAALRAWQQVLPQRLPAQACTHSSAPSSAPPCAASPRLLLAVVPPPRDALPHRAQHLLGRLADGGRGWHVVLVEPVPSPGDTALHLDARAAGPRLDRLRVGLGEGGAAADAAAARVADWLVGQPLPRPVLWVDGAAPELLVQGLRRQCAPVATVVDAARAGAVSPALLAAADRVLVAEPAQVATFGQPAERVRVVRDGVDLAAFARRNPRHAPRGWDAHEAAQLTRALGAGPCIGYAGAIDARVDLALLAQLATARPQWQFMLVGPVCGVCAVPQAPNLHWLGAQPPRLVPVLMQRWCLALLPWHDGVLPVAPPRQLLEALAAGLPMVAPAWSGAAPWQPAGLTPATRRDAPSFLHACEVALAEPAARAAGRRAAAPRVLRAHRWVDVLAALEAAMKALPEASVEGARPSRSGAAAARPADAQAA